MINGYKIGAGINYWDDPFGLINLLDDPSFYRVMDKIYLINGRYKNRTDEPEHNPKLLTEITTIYSKIILVDMEDCLQIEKRNKYWELAERDKLDFMVVVDSDETMRFTPEIKESLDYCMKQKEQCFPIVMEYTQALEMPRPRLFKAPFNFRHKNNSSENTISHGSLYNPDGVEMINQIHEFFAREGKLKGLRGVFMSHNKKFRTKRRVDMDYKYYEENPNR